MWNRYCRGPFLGAFVVVITVIIDGCSSEVEGTPLPETLPIPELPSVQVVFPSATPTPSPTPWPSPESVEASMSIPTPTPTPTPRRLNQASIDDLDPSLGETLGFDSRNLPQPLDIYAVARMLLPDADLSPPGPPTLDEVGDSRDFNIIDSSGVTSLSIAATLCIRTEHGDFYVQNEIGIPCSAFKEVAARFEDNILPTVVGEFAPEGIWEGDIGITLLHADIPGVGGYFDTADLYPLAINPRANGRNILYLNAKGDGPGNPKSPNYDRLVAHELQHAIHRMADPDEETWINEGLSRLAETFFGPSYEFDYFVGSCPPTNIATWPEKPGVASCNYAGAGLFMGYLRGLSPEEYMRDIVVQPGNGLRGIAEYLRSRCHRAPNEPLTPGYTDPTKCAEIGIENVLELFADWAQENYLQARLQGEATVAETSQVELENWEWAGELTQFAPTYFHLNLPPGQYQVEFHGSTITPLIPQYANESGGFWHAGGHDSAIHSVSRRFDLRDAKSADAVLTLLLRYDTEDSWDYAYTVVSTDDGATWTPVRSAGMSEPDKSSSRTTLGPGFTGDSGPAPYPEWVLEEFDLADFAGHEVTFRIIYVTDAAIVLDGVSLGGAWLPATNYSWHSGNTLLANKLMPVSTEMDAGGGWTGDGFFFSNNFVEQGYQVSLFISVSSDSDELSWTLTRAPEYRGTSVTAIDNTGDDFHEAVLMVMPTAPQTRQHAVVKVKISPLTEQS